MNELLELMKSKVLETINGLKMKYLVVEFRWSMARMRSM